MKLLHSAILIVATAFAGCSQASEESIRLAKEVQRCMKRGNDEAPVSVPVRIALTHDGAVTLVEVKGRDSDQRLYDAQDAIMRAIESCAPYHVGRSGEFEIVLTY